MFRTTINKLLFSAAVCGFAVTPIFAGGHGGGGHGGGGGHVGGGGHMSGGGGGHFGGGGGSHFSGGSHFGGGQISGGRIGGAPSSGFRSGGISAPSISHGGGGSVQRAPSMSGGAVQRAPSMGTGAIGGHSTSGGAVRSTTPSYGSPSVGRSIGSPTHSQSVGRSAIGGASINSSPGFTQRHFSGSNTPVNQTGNHSLANHSSGSNSLVNHTVAKPSFGNVAGGASAHHGIGGTNHGTGGFNHGGQNNSGYHHSTNNNWHSHPARQTSFFLGIGSPFGAYWGYPGYSSWPYYYSSYWSPWYRYSSFGYSGYGYGYASPAFGYQSVCTYNNAYYLPATNVTTYSSGADAPIASQPVTDPNAQPSPLAADQDPAALGDDFATLGEQEFRAGRYDAAARSWRHALVDEPGNGGVMLLMAQALFATGKYDEAAGAIQLGMQMLPVEKWGAVVEHYRELYPKIGDYTTQLRALEAARDKKVDDPALRFLLGYHYGYLGYPKNAVQQLDKCLELAPKDELSQKLQERMKELLAAKAPKVPVPTPPVPGNSNAPPAKPDATTPPVTAELKTP